MTELLTAWDKVQIARHSQRPHTLDYIRRLCCSFFEFHGDRHFGDDAAIVAGVGQTSHGAVALIGHQKGRNTRENIQRNFGMPRPEGFRKAQRVMHHAQKFGMPLICFLDTPGAQPSMEAEERGQAQAIAQSLIDMAGLEVPIISVVIGEGSSGGALAIGMADCILMLEHAIYAVASPEASASILWRDASKACEAAQLMKITAQDLLELGVIEAIIPEPPGGAHTDTEQAISSTIAAIACHMAALQQQDRGQLVWNRYRKYRAIGQFTQAQEHLLETQAVNAQRPHARSLAIET